jgi:hypothetical protein
MARGEKTRAGNLWTEAKFMGFLKGAIRGATRRWPPKTQALKDAWVERGVYRCAGYKRMHHDVPVSVKVGTKRVRNVAVDHINPVVCPVAGFTSWDELIDRMFVEADGFQVLCTECHKKKTGDERKIRAANKQ